MRNVVYASFRQSMLRGRIDLEGGTLRAMLVTSRYQPNAAGHRVLADVVGEVVGDGYAAGGLELSGKLVSHDDGTGDDVFGADNLVWDRASITARGVVVYADTGDPKTSPLVCYADFGKDVTSTDGPFAVGWGERGILVLGD